MTVTKVWRKRKQTIIAASNTIAIFTTVQRRSSRCSRNGFDVSLSGTSRNLKMSRSTMILTRAKRDQTAGGEPRADGERIRIANLVFRNHSAQFQRFNGPAFENSFAFLAFVRLRATHRPDEKKITVLVR